MSFGLRNVNDPKKALRELLRVTKPGGRLVICEFSHPPSRSFNGLYRFYNDRVLPVVAKTVSSNADAYDYLNESIRDWPDQRTLGGVDPRGRVARMSRTATSRSASWRCTGRASRARRSPPRRRRSDAPDPGRGDRPDPGRLDG